MNMRTAADDAPDYNPIDIDHHEEAPRAETKRSAQAEQKAQKRAAEAAQGDEFAPSSRGAAGQKGASGRFQLTQPKAAAGVGLGLPRITKFQLTPPDHKTLSQPIESDAERAPLDLNLPLLPPLDVNGRTSFMLKTDIPAAQPVDFLRNLRSIISFDNNALRGGEIKRPKEPAIKIDLGFKSLLPIPEPELKIRF